MPNTKVLVVDDEPQIVSLLQMWLEEDGYTVYTATTAAEALRLYFQHRPTLSTVDLLLPGMDGFQLITRIREISDGHVLVISALGADEEVIRGLDLGADDYLVKPVLMRVFLARVRSLLRRASPPAPAPSLYSDPSLTLNFLTHEAEVRGKTLYLRPTDFKLLACLATNNSRVIGHMELLDRVWGDQGGSLDSLTWYVSALRQKLEEDHKDPRLIVTVPRVGYRYIPDQAA